MRSCPSRARWRTDSATPGPSSWQTAGNGLGDVGTVERDGRQPELLEELDPWVGEAQVGEEDAVDALRARQVAVAVGLRVEIVADDLQQQRLAAGRQLELDPGDERHVERVGAQHQRVAGDHQADRVLAAPAE